MLGYSAEEAIGRGMEETLTPASRQAARERLSEVMGRGYDEQIARRNVMTEWEILRKDGSTVWAEVSISFIRDAEGHLGGLVGTLRDVSQRKKAEEALRDSEQRLRQVFEAVADGIAVTDLQGSITQANQSLARTHGFGTRDDIIGKNISDLIDPKDHDKVMRRIQHVLDAPGRRGFGTTEYTLKRADGSRIPSASSSPRGMSPSEGGPSRPWRKARTGSNAYLRILLPALPWWMRRGLYGRRTEACSGC
ncbi:MAG: PAS domain S-box protein [Chloroflexi bacterium]|nr:PAS domain S-box protein [Chloroflexota bacterium]